MKAIGVSPPTITRLRVRNYRSLANVDVTLGPLTVLVGPNGAGKSNLVDVLRFVRDALTRGLDTAILERGGMSAIRRWSAKGAPYDVYIHFYFGSRNWSGEYSFTLGSERRGEYRVKREWYSLKGEILTPVTLEIKDGIWTQWPTDEKQRLSAEMSDTSNTTLTLLYISRLSDLRGDMIYQLFSNMGFYTIYPDTLREPQKPAHFYPLDEKGRNLASVLRELKKESRVSSLLQALGKVVPGVNDYSVTQVGGYLVTRLRHKPTKENSQGPAFELARESDGTLRMLGILTALYQDPPRSLLTIEEPELTIHPGALGVLRDVLQEGSLRSQVIVTTHSPDLISDLPADALRVVEKKDGVTQVGLVSQMQREAIAEMLFSPGELMRMEGLHRETGESPGE
jgi:predicted ATPase